MRYVALFSANGGELPASGGLHADRGEVQTINSLLADPGVDPVPAPVAGHSLCYLQDRLGPI